MDCNIRFGRFCTCKVRQKDQKWVLRRFQILARLRASVKVFSANV
jgi:hypothetical protein